jgi:hypothetical protein
VDEVSRSPWHRPCSSRFLAPGPFARSGAVDFPGAAKAVCDRIVTRNWRKDRGNWEVWHEGAEGDGRRQ